MDEIDRAIVAALQKDGRLSNQDLADVGKNDGPAIAEFEQRVAAMPEVVELRRMYSRPDYFIRVRVRDSEQYEQWLTKGLLGNPGVARVDSRITMKVIKSSE